MSRTPSATSPIVLNSYEFDGHTISGTILIQNLEYRKDVSLVHSDGTGDFRSDSLVCPAVFGSAVNATVAFETWYVRSCAVDPAIGVSQFYLVYKELDSPFNTFYDNNGGKNYDATTNIVPTSDNGFVPSPPSGSDSTVPSPPTDSAFASSAAAAQTTASVPPDMTLLGGTASSMATRSRVPVIASTGKPKSSSARASLPSFGGIGLCIFFTSTVISML